ncbi:unnamed protein product, partial [Mesorhabditis belari]|uniref:RRM domain-containing protein n=1 Tax=Mesorhabditis belari TaxID=2138241 RepID=A0AAF3EB75_9BILA
MGNRGGSGRDHRRDDRYRERDDSRSHRREPPRENRRSNGTNQQPMEMHGMDKRMMGGGDRGERNDRGNAVGARNIQLTGQPFTDNELLNDVPKKKFTGRCRLFIGNLPNDMKEEELKQIFTPHGDISECYLSGKGFAFLRLDTRAHAESAKEAVDGLQVKGRQVRVRFAVHGAALRVKELSPTVSNEMLYHAFAHFGDIERAVHVVDEKGRPTGEGIVEFERKPSANEAIAQIRDKVFLITACPKPLVAELQEPKDEDDGLAERMIPRNPNLQKEREIGPRFPAPNSFEYVYGMKWKELYELEKQRRAQLEEELKESRRRLEADMELAYQDYQAQMLREDLQRRQQELERLEAARRERMASLGGGRSMVGGPPAGVPAPFMQQQQSAFPGGNNPFGLGSMSVPPPQHQPFAAPPVSQPQGQGGARPNVIEGVQRLLQIFKNDERGPQQPGSAFGGFQQGHFGGGAFGGPPPDYNAPPPSKRDRR